MHYTKNRRCTGTRCTVLDVHTDTGIALTASPGRPYAANGGHDVGFNATT